MPVKKQFRGGSVSVPNTTAQNLDLSICALGALTRMSSYSENFEFKAEWLQKSWKMGRDKVRSILRELREAGHLRIVPTRGENGQMSGQVWWVSTEPDFLHDEIDPSEDLTEDNHPPEIPSGGPFDPRLLRPSVNTEDIKKEESSKKNEKEKKNGSAARTRPTFDEIVTEMKANPAYTGIDVDRESLKAATWIKNHPGRQFTKNFFINWLNKVDAPIDVSDLPAEQPTITLPKNFVPLPHFEFPEMKFGGYIDMPVDRRRGHDQ